ncbi:Wzz/FepE/Etk N-terminal domain-containing protein [Microbacterium betulae]|uniref:Wzz/FepE/Etk N-terminal domain-containing protein n=1 Tax=Microbacterium betulae TaxID=2981139 RepID=A0AA97I4I2_9MICO|nr:Wzz/FepE/Etk N-terminal domain-containing protein [Microbacterium sp. AB]WOF22636.1 Wzz/FepE/Etk N-terminal domain-containing protein [Microbacterium sp. AB]
MNDAPHAQTATTLGLGHYGRVLVRHWRLIAAGVAVGALAAGAFLLVTPSQYTATTQVNLSVITTDPFNPQRAASGLLDDATESAIARSYVVAERATALLDDRTEAAALHDAVEVTISEGGTVAHVSATAGSRDGAVDHADAVASAYLAYRSEQAEQRLDVMVSGLGTRIDDLNAQLADANAVLAGSPGGTQEVQATSDREQILVELEGLLSQRNALQSVDTTGGSVLTGASDSAVGVEPSRRLAVATGLAAGLVLGVVAAFARHPFDRRLRSAAEAERILGRRTLTRLRSSRPRAPFVGDDAEALRVARERLLAELPGSDTTLLVVDDSDTDGEHGSEAAAGLAVATAQAGSTVQLVLPHPPARRIVPLRPGTDANPDEERAPRGSFAAAGLTVHACRPDADALTRDVEVREAIESAPPGTRTILALPSSCGEAELLAGIRLADAVVVVLREDASTTTTAGWLLAETLSAATPLLGAVMVPRRARRRLRERLPAGRRDAPASAPETEGRRPTAHSTPGGADGATRETALVDVV